jgi:hypothetical protein
VIEGRYTINEIDTMRNALEEWRRWDGRSCEPHVEGSFPGNVEDVLRTYMLAGATTVEVCAHALAKRDEGYSAYCLERAAMEVRRAKRLARELALP